MIFCFSSLHNLLYNLAKNAPHKVLIPVLSNCGIPNEVAPQQSFSPLPATVSIKVSLLKNYLTLSYPHSY